VYREISLRTVYTMLAKPVHRFEFLLGKYLGLVAVLGLEVAVMVLGFWFVLWTQGSRIDLGLLYGIGLVFVELNVLTSIALFFSSFTTPYLAGMFTVGLWITGHLLADLRAFGEHSSLPPVRFATELLYWVLPNLDRLDLKSEAAEGEAIAAARVAVAALYGALYSLGLLVASAALFRRRDFR
jgi:ABC-type transport system involved in multi-copper enzyme maturation permease subunit